MSNLPEVKEDDSDEIKEQDKSTEIKEHTSNNLPVISRVKNTSKITLFIDILLIVVILSAIFVYVANIRVIESEPTDEFIIMTPLEDVEAGQSVVYFDKNRQIQIGKVNAVNNVNDTVRINDAVGGYVIVDKNAIKGKIIMTFDRPDFLKGIGKIFYNPL